MMVSFSLLTACLLAGAAWLLLVGFLWYKLENVIPALRGFPDNLVEKRGVSWFISCFVIEFIFFAFVPAVVYSWFYTVIPFYGIRGGIAVGLYVYIFGMVPLAVLTMFRIKIPSLYIMYLMLGLLIKLIGCMAIIGYLYIM
jgi:hypothetical protein